MQCKQKANLAKCNCTYKNCQRKGICCECIRYHQICMTTLSSIGLNKELPACCFPVDVEKTYDRSIERFVEINNT